MSIHRLVASVVPALVVLVGLAGKAQASPFSCDSDISKKSVINLLAKHYGKAQVYSFNPYERQWAPYLLETVKKGGSVKSSIRYYYNAHLVLAQDRVTATLAITGGQAQGVEVYVCPYKVTGSLSSARLANIQDTSRSTSDGSESRIATGSARGANVFMIFLRPKTRTAKSWYTLSAD